MHRRFWEGGRAAEFIYFFKVDSSAQRESEEGAARPRVSCRGQSIITTLPQRLHLKLEARCVWNPGVGEKALLSLSTQKFLLFGIFPTRAFDCIIFRLYWNDDGLSESLKVII